jgi:hypothetical protein
MAVKVPVTRIADKRKAPIAGFVIDVSLATSSAPR